MELTTMQAPVSMEPITVRVKEAERISGISRRKLYDLLSSGEIASGNVGTIRLVNYASLRAYLERISNGQSTRHV